MSKQIEGFNASAVFVFLDLLISVSETGYGEGLLSVD